jgi:hypothetical protein
MDKDSQGKGIQPTQEKKDSIASKALVATAFGYVGAKIGTIGSLVDANEILKEQKLTTGEKIGSLFNGKLWKELKNQTAEIMEKENKGLLAASTKTMKYGIITTAIGATAGVAVGWVRGGRVDNWKDIVKHPWESTKIVFGAEKPEPKKDEPQIATTITNNTSVIPKNSEQETSTNWQNYTKERQQNSVVAGKVV